MKGKTKKALLAVTCVALVAVMTVAGTFAYFQDTSEDVVNTFKTNSVQVDLTESGDKNYDIIPGATAAKDPKVQATVTLPSYVFVEITDVVNAQGKKIVEYTIDSQWMALGEEYPNVYYREITKSDEEAVSVLADNTVTYPASLTNEDMELLEDGKNTLSFKASAIQKEPFNDPVKAYQAIPTMVSTADELKAALEHAIPGKPVQLAEDISLKVEQSDDDGAEPVMTVTADTILDLNGKTISLDVNEQESLPQVPVVISVDNKSTLTITGDGVIDAEAGDNCAYGINVVDGSLIIEDGKFYGAMTCVQVQEGSLTIEGGFFDLASTIKKERPNITDFDPFDYLINCIDKNWKNGTARVTITGGTFVNFDPSKSNSEDPTANWIPDGYEVITEEKETDEIWYTVQRKVHEVGSGEDLLEAVGSAGANEVIRLTDDITLTENLAIEDDVIIDLNNNMLTVNADSGIELENASLTLENGAFKWNDSRESGVSVALRSGSEFTLDHVEVITNATINVEKGVDSASLNIIDSTITSTDYYCVSTNAGDNTTGKNVEINVVNSTLIADETKDHDCAAILFNIPGKLNITNSNLTADRQAVIVRCGTAVIQDSTLTCTGEYTGNASYYDNEKWDSGNEVPVAVLVVGNRSSAGAYPYDASCTLEDTVLSIPESSNRSAIYAAAYNGHTTTLTFVGYDEDTVASLYKTDIASDSTFYVETR